MSTAIVSFIGTGRRKVLENGVTYDRTKYDFGDDLVMETSMFFNAVVKSGKYDLSEAIIIGTETSTWGALLEDHLESTELEDLYLTLEEELVNKRCLPGTLAKLESSLSAIWRFPIRCVATDSEICEKNAFEIISLYFRELALVDNKNILIDITHGFRSMPILLMSALQLNETLLESADNIELIYGEFKKESPSPVRNLDAVWRGVLLSRAVNTFFQKFDATDLSEAVKPFWPSGAKALTNLGDSLQGNLLIWLNDTLKQLKNALKTEVDNAPTWFPAVKKRIEVLYDLLTSPKNNFELCLRIADLFAERRVYGQAIIALQLSLEAFLFELYDIGEEYYGDFDKTKELAKKFHGNTLLTTDDKKKLRALNNTRNMIAHGGSRSTHGGKPSAANLPGQFNSYRGLILRITDKVG